VSTKKYMLFIWIFQFKIWTENLYMSSSSPLGFLKSADMLSQLQVYMCTRSHGQWKPIYTNTVFAHIVHISCSYSLNCKLKNLKDYFNFIFQYHIGFGKIWQKSWANLHYEEATILLCDTELHVLKAGSTNLIILWQK